MKMPADRPYLSVVVTSRNDDHGGNLLRRMQVFVNDWLSQCRRHALSAELIVVEWNPPVDRAPLGEALRWPEPVPTCPARIIRVPAEVHQRYQHAHSLPLYQMIAKNVGIRRSRGRFVLATNIDLVFSDDVIRHLAEERLESGCFYRMDRYDSTSDLSIDAPIGEHLQYCAAHLLRVNAREGTFRTTAEGARTQETPDVSPAGSGIRFGHGWFPPEWLGDGRWFRWMEQDAEILLDEPPHDDAKLHLQFEPGPSAPGGLRLRIADPGGRTVSDVEVKTRVTIVISANSDGGALPRLHLEASGGGIAVDYDLRLLNLRIVQCTWDSGNASRQPPLEERAIGPRRAPGLAAKIGGVLRRAAHSNGAVEVSVPVPGAIRKLLRYFGGSAQPVPHDRAPAAATDAQRRRTGAFLHTNACGDFTLMSRERWFDLRGYPELDLFSMHLDSVLCYAAYHAGLKEEMLLEPMRIYHIEHQSGWTPEQEAQLYARLEAQKMEFIDHTTVVRWVSDMRRLHAPLIFNHENWGLAEMALEEILPCCDASAKSCKRPQR